MNHSKEKPSFAVLSQQTYEVSRYPYVSFFQSLRKSLETAVESCDEQSSAIRSSIVDDEKTLETGYVTFAGGRKEAIDETQYKDLIQWGREEIAASNTYSQRLSESLIDLNRVRWCLPEMYYQDPSYQNPDKAYTEHEARLAFQTHPHEEWGGTDECWKTDKRSVGEILAESQNIIKEVMTLLRDCPYMSGPFVDETEFTDVTAKIADISSNAQQLQKTIKPAIKRQ